MKTELHIKYLRSCLALLPEHYSVMDSNRLPVLFFTLSGLDLLNALDKLEDDKIKIIDWIYSLQVLPDENMDPSDVKKCGFHGGHFLDGKFDPAGSFTTSNLYEGSHTTMTYTALLCLLILGDDLSRVNKKAIIEGLKFLQLENGSFYPHHEGGESDMRFLYCACCISYILDDWSSVNKELSISYIKKSFGFDFGIAQGPDLESHGGSTFCALASLDMMGALDTCFNNFELERLKRWCLLRQKGGFQGRPNKPLDTCYSFWVGASLKLLGAFQFINYEENHDFLMLTEDKYGGFSKWNHYPPDILHTYFGIGGLSLMDMYNLQPLSPTLNISERALNHLKSLQNSPETVS